MTKPYNQLSSAEKAMYHLHRAEHFQRVAEALEARADARSANDQLTSHLLTHDDEFAFPYRQATGNRNAHQQQAIMYSLVALLESS